MEFNNANIKELRGRISAALDAEFDGSPIEITIGRISYSSDKASIKVEAHSEGTESSAKTEWDFGCSRYGLKPEDFGRQFNFRGTRYRIAGLKTSRPKYPMQVERVSDDSSFKMTQSMVRAGIDSEPLSFTGSSLPGAEAEEVSSGFDLSSMASF